MFKNSVDGKNFKPLRKNSKENHSPAVLCSHASNEAESMCSDSSDDTCGVRTLDVKSAVISCGDSFNIVRTSFYSLNRSRPV